MKVKKKEIPGILFIVFSCAFYMLKKSSLFFEDMKVVLLVGTVLGYSYLLPTIVHKNKNNKWILALLLCVLITFIRSTDTRMIVAFSAIVVGMNLNPEILWKTNFYSRLFFFALAMLFGWVGHINEAAMQIGALMFSYLLYRNRRFNLIDLFGFVLLYVLGVVYTKSGSFIVSVGLTIALLLFQKRTAIRKFLESKFVGCIYPVTMAANIVMCLIVASQYYYRVQQFFSRISFGIIPRIIEAVNQLTSSRLILGGESLHRYGVSFWGGNIKYETMFDGFTYFQVDSGMLWLLQGWGLIMTVIVLGLFTFTVKKLQNERNYYFLIVAIALAFWSVNEDMLVSISVNIMFFMVGQALESKTNRAVSLEKNEYGNT